MNIILQCKYIRSKLIPSDISSDGCIIILPTSCDYPQLLAAVIFAAVADEFCIVECGDGASRAMKLR